MKQTANGYMQPYRRNMVAAVVLGTALLATASNQATAAEAVTVNDISRYCTACWRNARLPADCWTDCTQDVFARLMERVSPEAWHRALKVEGDERREFLRAIDAVKKRTQRGRKWLPLADDGIADRRDLDGREVLEERQRVARAAEELLTARQQRILQMSFEGWSVQEIAGELRTPAERVSDEKYKAVRKLRERLHFDMVG